MHTKYFINSLQYWPGENLLLYYRNDGYDRVYRGEYEQYRKKDDPYAERYRENWSGRREPEGWSTPDYVNLFEFSYGISSDHIWSLIKQSYYIYLMNVDV